MTSLSAMSQDDPALDFLSTSFDPLKVLQATPTHLSLPHPTVQPCDNLQTYTSVIQGTRQIPRPLTPPKETADVKEGVVNKGCVARKAKKTVFDFMQGSLSGPLSLLQRCRVEGRHVRVLTRHCEGVRGVCQGNLIVFDRHMNLVLSGVQEWCTPFRTRANGGITTKPKRKNKSPSNENDIPTPIMKHTPLSTPAELATPPSPSLGHTPKWEVYRTVNQLFIRGDQVVLISNSI